MKFYFVVVYFLAITLQAQEITVSGYIYLSQTNQALTDISVYNKATNRFTITDADGYYSLKLPPDQILQITASAIGFKEITSEVRTSQENISLNFELEEDIIDLPIININANSSTGGMMGSMKLPGSAHYISRRELKEINSTNPHNILERIPGVQIQEEDGFGLRPNIGLRGSGSERSSKITIMEDGILSAPAPYAAPSAYYFPTMFRMSGIEVIKGASQINHGPFTTGGVINLISTPIPNRFKGRVKLGVGSFGGRNIHANVGSKHGNISYLVETFQYSAEGFKKIDFSGNETGFNKRDFLAKVRWNSNDKANIYQFFEFKIGESKEHSDETYLGLSFHDFDQDPFRRYAGSQQDEMNTKHRQLALRHLINPVEKLYITTSLYQNNFCRNWYKLDNVSDALGNTTGIAAILQDPDLYDPIFTLVKGRTGQSSELLFVKANNRAYTSRGLQTKINYLKENHSLEFGARYHYDEMDRFQWVDAYRMDSGNMLLSHPGSQGTESNRIESASAFASYFKYKFQWKRGSITAGLRYEDITISRLNYGKEDPERLGLNIDSRSNDVAVWIPGLSFQYTLNDYQELFGGIHKGFAPPGSALGTNPELSLNYELGFRFERTNLYGSLVAFYNDYTNLLGSDLNATGGLGTGDQFNGGEARSFGVEVSVNYNQNITDKLWLPFQLQYTFTDAIFQTNFESDFDPWSDVKAGDHLPYLANHSINGNTGINSKKWKYSINANYRSLMRIRASSGPLVEDEYIPSRLVLSSQLTFRYSKDIDFTIGVQNLTNNIYAVASRPAGWRPGAPRSLVISLDARF